MTVRVVLADDHAPMRLGVRLALEEDGGFVVVGEAATASSAVAAARAHQPDVVLLDVNMPGGGISAARTITQQVPEAVVVMLTVSRDDGDLFEALRAGARGYLLKDIPPSQLPRALRGVLSGEAALPRNLVARLVEEFRARERAASSRREGVLGKLTDREWEVLGQMAQGSSTQQMADELFVAPVTVRTYVAAILKKLQVPDREAAIRFLKNQ